MIWNLETLLRKSPTGWYGLRALPVLVGRVEIEVKPGCACGVSAQLGAQDKCYSQEPLTEVPFTEVPFTEAPLTEAVPFTPLVWPLVSSSAVGHIPAALRA